MSVIEWFILFLMGSVFGWILENFHRNVIDKEKVRSGFLKGPYLPIYGFTIILLYFIINLKINLVYQIILVITLPTLLELVTGIIYEKYFRIKLWDCSERFLNYKGIICFRFSSYWVVISIIYLFILHNSIKNILPQILANANYIFIFGVIAGIFLLEEFYAFNIAFKIRKIAKKKKEKRIDFYKFKENNNISK